MPTYTNADGHRLSYTVTGEGPPVFLLHGIIQSAMEWHRAGWVEGLADLRQVVVVDLLGHGESDRPRKQAPYRVETRARDVLGLGRHLGVDRFDLLGFSLGGRVGYEIAARHPEALRGLVVLGQHAGAPRDHRQGLDRQIQAFRSGRLPAMERGLGIPGTAPDAPVNDPEVMALSLEALLAWGGAEDALGNVRAPALICAGEDDPAYAAARSSAQTMPNAEFLSCGKVSHQGSFYAPEASLPSVRSFLIGLDLEEPRPSESSGGIDTGRC